MPLGQVLYPQGRPPSHAYFPTSSLVALLYEMENGATSEIAVVGNEGMVGVALFMGGGATPSRAAVQSAGEGFRLPAQVMTSEFDRSPHVAKLMLRFTQALIVSMLGGAPGGCDGGRAQTAEGRADPLRARAHLGARPARARASQLRVLRRRQARVRPVAAASSGPGGNTCQRLWVCIRQAVFRASLTVFNARSPRTEVESWDSPGRSGPTPFFLRLASHRQGFRRRLCCRSAVQGAWPMPRSPTCNQRW